jgi:hypothetical protein
MRRGALAVGAQLLSQLAFGGAFDGRGRASEPVGAAGGENARGSVALARSESGCDRVRASQSMSNHFSDLQ